jgi:O-antigen/teichoic acid export membrane protein
VFSTLPVFSIIFLKIDTVMLSIIKGDAPVGWYNAAYSLVLGFQPIPSLFMNCLFPMMSNCYGSSKETLKIIYEKSFRYMFILGLPAAIGITLLSEKIILNFYGNQYINSIVILQILAWDTLLIFIRKPLDMLLISMNREKKVNIFLMTTAVLNIILNLVFIPFFSGIGAAMTTIICEFVLFLIYLHSISKYFHNLPIFTLTIHSIISSIVMAGSIYYLKNLNLILLIICSGIIYFAVFYLIGGFLKEEIKLIKNIKKDFLGDLSKLAAKD